ncbi:MAG: phosphatase PAP2 family protein [Vicinamibacteria bacterium]|nr:phosphatase PAP2 family protein [Vicinamibacteria bacterium]
MPQVLALLHGSDGWVDSRLCDWRMPARLVRWMRVASYIGDGWLWIISAATTIWFTIERRLLLIELLLAVAIANSAIVALKRKFRRTRPSSERPNPPLGLPHSKAFDFDEFSFPSGHTVNAFALAVVLAAYFPLLAVLWFLIAANIGMARILLRFHHPTDVLAGALIGTLIGSGVHFFLAA